MKNKYIHLKSAQKSFNVILQNCEPCEKTISIDYRSISIVSCHILKIYFQNIYFCLFVSLSTFYALS